jgi:glycosyltransferase involved in cell wall biosynthesis
VKIDLVIWTLNSARTLEATLSSLERTIPDSRICHRVIVDGGSADATKWIAEDFGWEVYQTKRGLLSQANFALNKVDTDMYASFEHDILLPPQWLPRMEKIMRRPDVAVAQGIRLITGNKALEAMYRSMYERYPASVISLSIDNTLYRTDMMREVGGYPFDNSWGNFTDAALWNEMEEHGYKWIVDTQCVCGHLRPNFRKHLKHLILYQITDVDKGYYDFVKKLSFSLIRGGEMGGKYHAPSAALAYPVFRYFLTILAATRGSLGLERKAQIKSSSLWMIDSEGYAERSISSG